MGGRVPACGKHLGAAAGRPGMVPGRDRPGGGPLPCGEPVLRAALGTAGGRAGPQTDPGGQPGDVLPLRPADDRRGEPVGSIPLPGGPGHGL